MGELTSGKRLEKHFVCDKGVGVGGAGPGMDTPSVNSQIWRCEGWAAFETSNVLERLFC